MNRILTILLALTLDLLLGDPPNRFHPLLLMGRWLKWGRCLAPRFSRLPRSQTEFGNEVNERKRFWFGAAWTLLGTALFALPWRFAKVQLWHSNLQSSILNSQSSIPPSLPSALALKPIFAYRNLRQAVTEVAEALAQDNLAKARRLTAWHLVSRDTSELSAEEVAGAAIESMAENLTDSVTAPLLAYAIGGLPAAWAYRFINTADAMWGYRTPEFEQLGKFSARLDDALNWLPARLTGWLLVLAAGVVGADAAQTRRTMLAYHATTPSPNAGWTMSAMAGALGVTLSKRGVYDLVGGGQLPNVAAIRRAMRIADVGMGLFVGVVGVGLWLSRSKLGGQ